MESASSPRSPRSVQVADLPKAPLKPYTALCVVCIVCVACTLGYDIGVMGGAVIFMSKTLDLTTPKQELAVGCLNFVSGFGALFTYPLNEWIGSPMTIFWSLCLYIIGMSTIALAFSFEALLVGRLIVGVGVGMGFSVCPQYIAEISPTAYRGFLVSCFEIAINVGLVAGYLGGIVFYHLPEEYNWRLMMVMPLPPAVVCMVAMLHMPHSPRWLFAHNRAQEAEEVLHRTCADSEVEVTLEEIRDVVALNKQSAEVSWAGMFRSPNPAVRAGLLIGICTAFFQQANGSEAAVYYVPYVLEKAGVREVKLQLWGSLVVGVFKLLFVVIGQYNLERCGRRPMLLTSIVGVTAGLMLLAMNFTIMSPPHWLAMVSLCVFMGAFSLGEGPVTWVLISEVFPLSVRSKGMSVAVALNRMTSGTIAFSFLSLSQVLSTGGTFWLFAAISGLHFIFTLFCVPETKGKSLEEIEEFLATNQAVFSSTFLGGAVEKDTSAYVGLASPPRAGDSLEQPLMHKRNGSQARSLCRDI